MGAVGDLLEGDLPGPALGGPEGTSTTGPVLLNLEYYYNMFRLGLIPRGDPFCHPFSGFRFVK